MRFKKKRGGGDKKEENKVDRQKNKKKKKNLPVTSTILTHLIYRNRKSCTTQVIGRQNWVHKLPVKQEGEVDCLPVFSQN